MSKRGSPRDSPVTVGNASKKRKRAESPIVEAASKLKRNARSTSKLAQETTTGITLLHVVFIKIRTYSSLSQF